ncbi:hypothetical protein [Arthrobacter sp. Soil736]|uniref:hypothetical protein n=1 Tax=Arthrobacter sp. Soil736 TaxID=1736395 RepID=UPI00191110F0|nr:hypothetical protein [Arthrobacter sp. Soil736]
MAFETPASRANSVGLPVSAVVSQYLDWRLLFMLSALLAAIAVVLVWRIIPASTVRSEGRFDIVWAIGLGAGFAAVLLGVSKGSSWGWTGDERRAALCRCSVERHQCRDADPWGSHRKRDA